MPKYQIEVSEVKEGAGCGSIIVGVIILLVMVAVCGK